MSLLDEEEGEEFIDFGLMSDDSESPTTTCKTARPALGFKRLDLKKNRSVGDKPRINAKISAT